MPIKYNKYRAVTPSRCITFVLCEGVKNAVSQLLFGKLIGVTAGGVWGAVIDFGYYFPGRKQR